MKSTTPLAALLLCATASTGLVAQQESAPNLFQPVPTNLITRMHENPEAIRQDNVYINFDLLGDRAELGEANPTINLNLFDDVNILATFESTEVVYGGGQVFHYSIGEHDFFYADFSILNGAVSGVIRSEGGVLYDLGNVGDGQFTVSEIDKSLFEACGTNSSHQLSLPSQQGGGSGRESGHTSHLMIVFTTDCVNAEGGIDGANSLANLSVSEMNRALAQGDSTFRVNLVHTYEATGYTQSGDQSTDLYNLRDTGDGELEEVHSLRDDFGADFIELFIANYGSGVGFIGCSNSDNSAFSVGRNTRVASTFTLAHELGHNMGLAHDRANAGSSCNSYAYGYLTQPSGAYGSIMSYPGTRQRTYSNPDMLAPNGEAMGVTSSEDSSRHIGENYAAYVAFRGGVTFYHQLETTFASDNGSGGNMFDIKPKADISLTSIAVNSKAAAGTSINVDVYYREGTWVGNDSSSNGWTLLQSLTGISAGQDAITKMDFSITYGSDKVFEQDKTYGLFVDLDTDCRYTNGVETYDDSFLRIESGCGKGAGGFSGNTFIDRIWNGILYYEGANGEHYLNTPMTGGISSWNGNMFDIEVMEDIVISSFDVNSDALAGTVTGFDVWYKTGSYVGHEDNPGDWTFLGSDTKATSAGPGAGTTIAISSPQLNAGMTYAFYIHAGGAETIHYTSGTGTFENSDMRITCGAGLNGPNPFGSVLQDRTWNGSIR